MKTGRECRICRSRPWGIDQTIALWAYEDRVRRVIVAAKFAGGAAIASALGDILASQILHRMRILDEGGSPPGFDLVTFVPSNWTRRMSRRGSGTRVLGGVVASRLNLPLVPCLRVQRQLKKQAWLTAKQRISNVRGAFALKKSYAPKSTGSSPGRRSLNQKHVLLVDDVMTSGATTNEVAAILRQAGAARITAAVVARAVR